MRLYLNPFTHCMDQCVCVFGSVWVCALIRVSKGQLGVRYVCTIFWWTSLLDCLLLFVISVAYSPTPKRRFGRLPKHRCFIWFPILQPASNSFVYLNNNIHAESLWLVPQCVCVCLWRCIWMFCPAGLSSVGLIIVVISLGSIREAREMGSPWKSHDGRRSADVQVPASRLSPAQEQPPRRKEPVLASQ